jgi:hypothetical protein
MFHEPLGWPMGRTATVRLSVLAWLWGASSRMWHWLGVVSSGTLGTRWWWGLRLEVQQDIAHVRDKVLSFGPRRTTAMVWGSGAHCWQCCSGGRRAAQRSGKLWKRSCMKEGVWGTHHNRKNDGSLWCIGSPKKRRHMVVRHSAAVLRWSSGGVTSLMISSSDRGCSWTYRRGRREAGDCGRWQPPERKLVRWRHCLPAAESIRWGGGGRWTIGHRLK